MQPLRFLHQTLARLADHSLFTLSDLHGALPNLTHSHLKSLVSRAVRAGILRRVCRGLYVFGQDDSAHGLLLFHAAARLRAGCFNYVSLETILSDAGVISQVPLQWITVMTSGRSNTISCGAWGTIEFIHTVKQPNALAAHLHYDRQRRMWCANVPLALQDMRDTHRNMELVDWSVAHEFI